MASVKISVAQGVYGGDSEAELLVNMAQRSGCTRIYKYANAYGDRTTHTDYSLITSQADENALLSSSMVFNAVLVYDNGRVLNVR